MKKKKKSALQLNKGIDSPDSLNPNFKTRKKKQAGFDELFSGIRKQNISALSKAVTLIESTKTEHTVLGKKLINACLPYSGKSIRIGITGVPGAGKSSFIETLGIMLAEEENKRIAVLAIDPSGSKSGGSILGDKTRMDKLGSHPQAYIRPSASAGTTGGVARKTAESIILCEAAGFDTVFIETVGVGQSEIAVKSMTDFFLMLQIAGAGDELQGIKRGITEAADMIVINKADGNNIQAAENAKRDFENALHFFPERKYSPQAQVLTASAYKKTGIREVWEKIEEFIKQTKANKYFYRKRREQAVFRMHEQISEKLRNSFYTHPKVSDKKDEISRRVQSGTLNPYDAADLLFRIYHTKTSSRD